MKNFNDSNLTGVVLKESFQEKGNDYPNPINIFIFPEDFCAFYDYSYCIYTVLCSMF